MKTKEEEIKEAVEKTRAEDEMKLKETVLKLLAEEETKIQAKDKEIDKV